MLKITKSKFFIILISFIVLITLFTINSLAASTVSFTYNDKTFSSDIPEFQEFPFYVIHKFRINQNNDTYKVFYFTETQKENLYYTNSLDGTLEIKPTRL